MVRGHDGFTQKELLPSFLFMLVDGTRLRWSGTWVRLILWYRMNMDHHTIHRV